jgi:hypothetical protein
MWEVNTMNKAEFASYCRQHISLEESGLPCPSVEDIERWTKHGYFRYAPQYHKDDIHLVFAILRNEKEFREAQAGKEVPESGKRLEQEKEPFRDKEPVTEYESEKWKQQIADRINSAEFQEMVALARKSLTLPENGYPPQQAIMFLFSASLAVWCNYCWSLETFQRKFLALKGEEARAEYLRPVLGEHAPLFAKYTMPEPPRAQCVDWLLCAKLIAARLSTFLGIDNGSDILLYLLSPDLRPPESWQLNPVTDEENSSRRQFTRFISAVLPVPETVLSGRAMNKTIHASVRLAFDLTKDDANWEQIRAAYRRMFPFYEAVFPDTLRMRARRAVEDLPYADMLKFVMDFFAAKPVKEEPPSLP